MMDIKEAVYLHEYMKENEEDLIEAIMMRIDSLCMKISFLEDQLEEIRDLLEENVPHKVKDETMPF